MGKRATVGTCLASLVKMAVPLCQQAERECPRTGPGRKPDIADWILAVLIMVAVLKRKKSKSSQYRFLNEHRRELAELLGTNQFPARSTYFDRYRRAHRLFADAIKLQGQKAIAEGIVDATTVAADKSLIAARGPLWHKSDRNKNRIPKGLRGVDRDSDWGCSKHDGWVHGYSFEVVVSATKNSPVFPLLASADTASAKETTTFHGKIDDLPATMKNVVADSGYDSNHIAERIEYSAEDRRTGRRFLCPENKRGSKDKRARKAVEPRNESHRRRLARRHFYRSRRGKAIYRRRSQTVEPFNEWFKSLFELQDRVWHRGLENNQTQLLATLFAYGILVRYNHRRGNENGQIRWIIDTL
ncbi:MAG TPA: transposase [Lacipirellulaceae bacterium]|nr:transposase [Lacipirellulaceae bacterium]